MARLGMAIDLDRCVGCGACVLACKSEWRVADGRQRTWVTPIGPEGTFPDRLESTFYVGQCSHCERPACVASCPTGAMAKDIDGRVVIESSLCIGCRYCVAACPYGACFIDPRTGRVDKCDFCRERMAAGAAEPACVQTCITEAKVFGDLDDPDSAIRRRLDGRESRQLITERVDIGPNLHFIGAEHHTRLILEHHPPVRPLPQMSRLDLLGAPLLGGAGLAIALFHWLHGPLRAREPETGQSTAKFSLAQRINHWLLAMLTGFLAVTGLILLYGGPPLTALFGASGFALVASAAKEMHNLFGPLFLLSVAVSLFMGAGANRYEKGDLLWLRRGGGLLTDAPLEAGRFNAGEKLFFWISILFGLLLSISGLALGFPLFGADRVAMEIAHSLHGVAALLFIALALGHAYLGSLGSEGALRGMTRGDIDTSWANTYHRRWHQASHERDGPVRDPSAPDSTR